MSDSDSDEPDRGAGVEDDGVFAPVVALPPFAELRSVQSMSLPPGEVAHSLTQEARTPPDGVRSNRVSRLGFERCLCPHPGFWAALGGASGECRELQTTIRRGRSKDGDSTSDVLLSAQLAVRDRGFWACFASEETGVTVRILARTPRKGAEIREVAEVTGMEGRLARLMAVMPSAPGTRSFRLARVDANRLLALVDGRESSACRIISRQGIVLLDAWSNGSGELVLTVVLPDGPSLQRAILRMKREGLDARVLMVSPATSQVKEDGFLTHHQREILSMALTRGYFESPKRIRLAELGKEFGISKTSAADVLRRAEKTLLRRAVPPEPPG